MKYLISICILILSFGANSWAENKNETILVLGDSLSAAYGIQEDQGWVNLLQQRLKQQGHTHRVVNASISGETSAGGASRVDKLLATYNPSILILELGANDGLRGLSIKAMRDNLESIIIAAQNAHAEVVLVGMRIPPNYGAAYTSMFFRAFSELAERHALPFVPFLFANLEDNEYHFQADALHPTAAAQPLLLDTVWSQVKQALTPQ